MFRNYFLISYRRHECFCPISVYIFTKQRCEYFFEETISVFFYHLCCGSNGANSLLLRNQYRSCDEHQASKQIDFHFIVKGGQTAGATEVWVTSFYVKPNPIICLCCVCKFLYFVYENLSMLCMTYFDYSFLSILCMTLSLTSTFLYII